MGPLQTEFRIGQRVGYRDEGRQDVGTIATVYIVKTPSGVSLKTGDPKRAATVARERDGKVIAVPASR